MIGPLQPPSNKTKKTKTSKPDLSLTAKGVIESGALNDNRFGIKADPDYLSQQIDEARSKLSLYEKPKKNRYGDDVMGPGGVRFVRQEVLSFIERLENRRRIKSFKEMLDKYPHTSTFLINQVIKNNPNLRCQRAADFIPDFPKEAIDAMKEYNQMCLDLCNKKTNFYVIASKEDFEAKDRRRDPILLAQSPFGFFWQVLGAWDKEMQYLGDL